MIQELLEKYGYWNGTLEREAIRQQQRHVDKPRPRNKQARVRIAAVLASRRRSWWSVSDIWVALGGDIDRTWLSSLLRELCESGQVARKAEAVVGGGRLWRYRVRT